MASHGYPPGLGVGFHQEHASSRVFDVRALPFPCSFILDMLDSWC